MKTVCIRPPLDWGTALLVTMLTAGVLVTLVGSYLYLVQTQGLSVARSQRWNEALVVAEGGVEDALALLNSGVQAPNFAIFPWTSVGGGVFKNDTNRPASKFGDSYYQVLITNGFAGANLAILSRGYVPGPIGSLGLCRTIRVEARSRPTFPVKGPMIVLQSFNGNGYVATDSFNSTLGPYNQSTAGNSGDVVTLTTNAGSVAIGQAKIKGNVRTPPGGIQDVNATIGPKGSVGDAAWVGTAALNNSDGQMGFEDGHFQNNFTLAKFADAALPNVAAWLPPMGGTAPDGLRYDYLLPSGNYQIADLTGSVYVGQTNTVLYVTQSISISGTTKPKNGCAPPQIHIAPGASVTVYMAGGTASFTGNALVNDSGKASAFAYYGLPTNTKLTLGGNAAFFCTIYAPQADFNLNGGGNNFTNDFTGASITRTTTTTGNFNFHYDESLMSLTTLGGYDAISWREL